MSEVIDARNRFGKRPATQPDQAASSGVSPTAPIEATAQDYEYRLVNLLVAAAAEAKDGRKKNARELVLAALKTNMAAWVGLPNDLGQLVEAADVAGVVFCDDDDDYDDE
jgi:hypothetical protein